MGFIQRILIALGLLAVAAVLHLWYCTWHAGYGTPAGAGDLLFTLHQEQELLRTTLGERVWSVQLWVRGAGNSPERALWLGLVLPLVMAFGALIAQFRVRRRPGVALNADEAVVLLDSDDEQRLSPAR